MSESMTWLTYAELASQLKIKQKIARQLAGRKRWSRQRGSDGKARVAVPDEVLCSPASSEEAFDATSHATDAGVVPPDHIERLKHALSKAEAKIVRLEGELEMAHDVARQFEREWQAAHADAQAATVQVDALQKALDVERERATETKDDSDLFLINLRAYFPWWRRLEGGSRYQTEDASISPKVPCAVRQLDEAFVVIDTDGREVCFVYYTEDACISTAGRWSREKARAIAGRISRGMATSI